MRAGLALFVLTANVIALVSILGTAYAPRRKLAWSAAVVALPLAGAFAWLAFRRTRLRRSQR